MWETSQDANLDENLNTTLQPIFTETFQLSKYEIKTLCSLSLVKALNDTSIYSISSTFLAVVLDDKLSVFTDDCFEIFWEHVFDSKCSYVTYSNDLSLLLVVEYPGTLNLLHIPSRKIIWSYKFEENGIECNIQNVFCSDAYGNLSIYVFTKELILYEWKGEISLFSKALEEETISDFFSNISIEKVELSDLFPNYCVNSAFENSSHLHPVGLSVETKISDTSISEYYIIEDMVDGVFTSDWEWYSKNEKFFECYDFSAYGSILKVVSSTDGRYIICLSKKNTLFVFCAFTHANLAEWGDGDIESFVMKNAINPDNLSKFEHQIAILRRYDYGHIFEIRKFPSFVLVHKVMLSKFVRLIEGKQNQDSWFILEADSDSSNILKMKSISECHPETRLLSLLKRKKFKEAEKYAKMCSLDNEIIFKTKITYSLEDYISNPPSTFTKDELDLLYKDIEKALSQIKDVDFIKSCIILVAPEMELRKKFLPCINTWLTANVDAGVEDLICQINNDENKLVTFNVLADSIHDNLSLHEFLRKDLLQYMISELISGNLPTALIIWQRHKDELINALYPEKIGEILATVSGVPSEHLIPFLENDFLPLVLLKIPEIIDLIADWIISHIHLLEIAEKGTWPENGEKLASMYLELIQTLLKRGAKGAISFSKRISLGSIHKNITNPDSRIGCLYELSKNLKLLVEMKEKFNCKIPLTTFEESKIEVIFAVLDRINLKYIVEAITEFARPFTLKNDLDLDLCLQLYIKNTLQNFYFTWWSWDEDPWEEHLCLVLQCIVDTNRWVNVALLLVSHAAVPWSNRIKNIVEQGLSVNHPSAEEFKQQSKQVGLKEVLVKYDIRNFPINNDVELVYDLVNFIFKQNRNSALEDAEKVLECCDSLHSRNYFKFLQFFLTQNKLDEFMTLFSRISTDTVVECSISLLQFISFNLEDKFLVYNNKENIKTLLQAAVYLLEFLKTKGKFDSELLNNIRSMLKLQKEFNIFVSLSDIKCKKKVFEMVENEINSCLNEEVITEQANQNEKKNTSLPFKIFKIIRYSDIVKLDRAKTMAILITEGLKRKMYNLVIKLCRELTSSYPTQSSETLIQVVNHFYKNFQNIKTMNYEVIVQTICYLSDLAVTFCLDDSIEDFIYVARLSNFLRIICKITGPQPFTSTMVSDTYHKWKMFPIYADEGFQLDIIVVADFIQKVFPFFLRNSCDSNLAIDLRMEDTFNAVFKPVIIHMKERGQGVAALYTILLFYHLQMEYLKNKSGSHEVFQLVRSNLKNCVIELIMRMIDSRKLDMDFSIGLLALFPTDTDQLLQKLQRLCSKDLMCVKNLGEIGCEFYRLFGNPSESSEYDKISKRASLLLKQNVKSAYVDVVLKCPDPGNCWDVVKKVILCYKVSLSTVLECCSAFNLIKDHVLVAFLNNLLLESDKNCISNVDINENELNVIFNEAKSIIDIISSEELLIRNLENILKKISSYSYEVLLFLHEQILEVSANVLTVSSKYLDRGIQLLNFLRVYKRVSTPSEHEIDHWNSMHPTDLKLPAITSKRLPFWLISDKNYKIINPELTAKTLIVWLRISSLLNMSPNELAMIAIKNNVMEFLEKLPANQFLLTTDNNFLQRIHSMLKNISEPELVVSLASWVTNKMPPGTIKVMSCLRAFQFSKKWCSMCPMDRNALDIQKKLLSLQQRSHIECILYQYNLANDISLSYIQNPVQLIEYFIEKFCNSLEYSIKICKMSLEIAKVISIDLNSILFKFFQTWLNDSTNDASHMNEDITIDLTIGEFHLDNIEENILRSINLLMGVSTMNHDILSMFKEKVQHMPSILRIRLIFCMISVYGYQYIAEALGIPIFNLEETLPLCLCSTELESLHFTYSMNVIADCNKVELVQRLLSNRCDNPKVLLLCVRICLEYNIWECHIWDIYFQKLVLMALPECLYDILQIAQGHLVHMWHYKSFISAWNCILSSWFKIGSEKSCTVIERVHKAILCCPCAAALDFESLWVDLKCCMKSSGKDIDIGSISDVTSFLKVLKSCMEMYET